MPEELPAGVRPGAGRRRRPGGRSARNQAAVFDAAIAALLEEGWPALSIGEIAARAGLHESSLYRRWGAKEALVAAALLDRMGDIVPLPDTGALRSDLREMLRALRAFLRSPLGAALVQMAATLPADGQAATLRRTFWSARFAVLRAVLERGLARGELPPGTDAQLVLETLIGPFYLRTFLIDDPCDEDRDEGLPGRVVDLVLGGATRPGMCAAPAADEGHVSPPPR